MLINPCIYDSEHRLIGCVTQSVLDVARSGLDSLRASELAGHDGLCAFLEDALRRTEATGEASFPNALKHVLDQRLEEPSVLRAISRLYRTLLRQCCGSVAYGEARQEFIERMAMTGFKFMGITEPDGRTVFIDQTGRVSVLMDLSDNSGVLSFFHPNGLKAAEVRCAGSSWKIVQALTPGSFLQAVRCCADDAIASADRKADLDSARELVDAARDLASHAGVIDAAFL